VKWPKIEHSCIRYVYIHKFLLRNKQSRNLNTIYFKANADEVYAGTLVRNCDATQMVSTQETQTPTLVEKRSNFETHKKSYNKHKLGHGL
jgi:hypothetical protein